MTLLTVDAKLMPILPLMSGPTRSPPLTVAFGMGSAFRAALIAGLKTDAVELVPSVPRCSSWFYPDAERSSPTRTATSSLPTAGTTSSSRPKRYDIIVTDPPPPIESSGVSVISSLEYYQAGQARLNPGGVMMQWVPYGATIDEFLAHIRTFRAVFPNVDRRRSVPAATGSS